MPPSIVVNDGKCKFTSIPPIVKTITFGETFAVRPPLTQPDSGAVTARVRADRGRGWKGVRP